MEVTLGQVLFYGGIAGGIVCLLIVFISLKLFEKRRKKILDKIMKEM